MTAYWLANSPSLAAATALPDAVDVAVIGGGLAGLTVAAELAESTSLSLLSRGRMCRPVDGLFRKQTHP